MRVIEQTSLSIGNTTYFENYNYECQSLGVTVPEVIPLKVLLLLERKNFNHLEGTENKKDP